MESQKSDMKDFPWDDNYQGKVSRRAWSNLIKEVQKLETKARKLHDSLWEVDNQILRGAYEETLRQLAEKLGLVKIVAPELVAAQVREVAERAQVAEERAEKLLAVLELTDREEVHKDFRETMRELSWLLDLKGVLSG